MRKGSPGISPRPDVLRFWRPHKKREESYAVIIDAKDKPINAVGRSGDAPDHYKQYLYSAALATVKEDILNVLLFPSLGSEQAPCIAALECTTGPNYRVRGLWRWPVTFLCWRMCSATVAIWM